MNIRQLVTNHKLTQNSISKQDRDDTHEITILGLKRRRRGKRKDG